MSNQTKILIGISITAAIIGIILYKKKKDTQAVQELKDIELAQAAATKPSLATPGILS